MEPGTRSMMGAESEAVYLREIARADIPLISIWRRDREVADLLGGTFRYTNEEVDGDWFEAYMRSRDRNVRLGVVLESTRELVGVAYILSIDWVNRSAEYGSFIGAKEHWGKGCGTAAEMLTLRHAFQDLNLHRMFATALAHNERALHMHEKNGFVREGVMKGAAFKNGEYRDVVMLGMTREDFLRLHG
jgi:RimJ/RimL family protein N-acetyltransferase